MCAFANDNVALLVLDLGQELGHLADWMERIIRPQDDEEPSMEQPHGLYVVRGDNVVVCGLVDEQLDESIDWTKVRGEVIGSTKHV